MNTDDIRLPCRQMRDAFDQLTQAYGTMLDRLGELEPGTERPDVAALTTQFAGGWAAVGLALAEYDVESDEIVGAIYEDALAEEEPWALEAFEARQR